MHHVRTWRTDRRAELSLSRTFIHGGILYQAIPYGRQLKPARLPSSFLPHARLDGGAFVRSFIAAALHWGKFLRVIVSSWLATSLWRLARSRANGIPACTDELRTERKRDTNFGEIFSLAYAACCMAGRHKSVALSERRGMHSKWGDRGS